MTFKLVNRHGQNPLGRTFKTQKKAKEAFKKLEKELGVSPGKMTIVKTGNIRTRKLTRRVTRRYARR